MSLSLQSRRVGDVTVVTCSGRLVVGEESRSLQKCLDDQMRENPHLVLHLGAVDFIDSGALGMLARYVMRVQNTPGTLKVCAVSPKIDEVLRITRLKSVFQLDETEADSIADVQRRAQTSVENPHILCVDESPDVLTYLRELLKEAGYRILTATNLADALILLKATQPKVVMIGAELRATRGTRAAEEFHRLADEGEVVELPSGFSGRDAGDAAQHVLGAVRAALVI